jgi:cobyrinic acid a,c-diamide synthase
VGETCFDWERLLPLLAAKSGGGDEMSRSPVFTPPIPPYKGGASDLAPSPVFSRFYGRETRPERAAFQGDGWGDALSLSKCGVNSKIRIAVAKDAAFNFYYADNLDILADSGAELVEWSPLTEPQLPLDVQGLYFGGGFPEVFAETLAANQPARAAVKAAIIAGMPTYAECGGLMYLCDRIVDFNDRSHPMVGIFPTTAVMGKKLTLGYRQLTFSQASLIAELGDRVWGHEFHRSTLTDLPASPLYNLQGYESNSIFAPEGWHKYNAQAAYTHLHFGARLDLPARFIECCRRFKSVFAS